MRQITLYTRLGCRLCEHARNELEEAAPDFEIREVDVDGNPDLQARYGYEIPVAVANGRELFRHRFDPDSIQALQVLGTEN